MQPKHLRPVPNNDLICISEACDLYPMLSRYQIARVCRERGIASVAHPTKHDGRYTWYPRYELVGWVNAKYGLSRDRAA